MKLLRIQGMRANMLEETPRQGEGPVEQYAQLADLLSKHPGLAGTLLQIGGVIAKHPKFKLALLDIALKLDATQDLRWTGKMQINMQTGEMMGGPTIKDG